MTSRELVKRTIRGENRTGVTPLYGWLKANLSSEISKEFGSVTNFEDHYQFDLSHIFGGPPHLDRQKIDEFLKSGEELTPEALLSIPLPDVDDMSFYKGVIEELSFYQKERERFCYIQTQGIFEALNDSFGIENHLCYLIMYPDELKEVYRRQAEWNKKFANNMIDLGVDMVHVSDDWGSQRSLLFSNEVWRELIFPNHKITADAVKKRQTFLSLHSDGCIASVLDGVVELGYDLVHPWQENSNMPYDIYLEKYSDKLGILGGLCVQSTIGFNNFDNLKNEISRVFSILKGQRWIFCTSHYVQNHCSIEELVYAYELALKLSGKRAR